MKVFKVFIGVPAYKWPMDIHTSTSIQGCMNHPGLDCELRAVIGDAHIERARAMVLAEYLTCDIEFDYFLNVDWDIEFRAEDLYRACSRGKDCIGGPYTYKTEEEGKKANVVFRAAPDAVKTEDHLLEAYYLGGGFTLLSNKLIQDLVEHYDDELGFNLNPDLQKDKVRVPAVWNPILIEREDWGKGYREMLSEDYSLCERIRKIGYKCWLDLTIMLKHWDGPKCYVLDVEEQA